jgi:isoleucyl-tRNA synthetase
MSNKLQNNRSLVVNLVIFYKRSIKNHGKSPSIISAYNLLIKNYLDKMTLDDLNDFIEWVNEDKHEHKLDRIKRFIIMLSKSYVNLNKQRFKNNFCTGNEDCDTCIAQNVLLECLYVVSVIIREFSPDLAEWIYKTICVDLGVQKVYRVEPFIPIKESVHLQPMPFITCQYSDDHSNTVINNMIDIINLVNKLLINLKIPRKMPIKELIIYSKDAWELHRDLEFYLQTINVMSIKIMEFEDFEEFDAHLTCRTKNVIIRIDPERTPEIMLYYKSNILVHIIQNTRKKYGYDNIKVLYLGQCDYKHDHVHNRIGFELETINSQPSEFFAKKKFYNCTLYFCKK